jgi:hypothetical protein
MNNMNNNNTMGGTGSGMGMGNTAGNQDYGDKGNIVTLRAR